MVAPAAGVAVNDSPTVALQRGAGRPTGGAQVRRRPPIKTLARQRSKSTSSSSASNRPATATVCGGGTSGHPAAASNNATPTAVGSHSMVAPPSGIALVTAQANGICRITRTAAEQQKMPDRINYDRRGLTAVPLFENEPNLRLLSLQHNLINMFHIPRQRTETPPTLPPSAPTHSSALSSQPPATSAPLPPSRTPKVTAEVDQSAGRRGKLTRQLSRLNCGAAHLQFNTSVASPSPPPVPAAAALSSSSPLAISAPFGGGAAHGTQHLLKRSHLLTQKNLNFNPGILPSGPPQYRFALKKSKSFMMNYSKHFGQLQRGQAHAAHVHLGQRIAASGVDLLKKSFDSSVTSESTVSTLLSSSNTTMGGLSGTGSVSMISELEEDEHAVQLEIKNRQLQPCYEGVFQQLVFLDLYDNQIERVANLDGLPCLSVLLLGKNRISDITGLASLAQTLRVLDLHGNKLTSIANRINCLPGLRSLNLAGNQIRQINQNDFNSLSTLRELNLKRNRLKRVHGFQHLVALERLWLCHNDLHKVDDMATIAQAVTLVEVTIENNPVSLAGDCVSFLVSYLPRLQSLSQMPITEQVRQAALAWRKQKDLSDAAAAQAAVHSNSSEVFNNSRREEVISNARTNWELLRSQQMLQAATAAAGASTTPAGCSGPLRRQARSPKHRELAKISESNEAVNLSIDDLQEYIKLPPIELQPQHQQHQQHPAHILEQKLPNGDLSDEVRRSSAGSSSGSSLGPNVDSSSSCFSSDNELEEEESAPDGRRAAIRRSNGSLASANAPTPTSKPEQQLRGILRAHSQMLEGSASPSNRAGPDNNSNSNGGDLRANQIVITTTPPEATTSEMTEGGSAIETHTQETSPRIDAVGGDTMTDPTAMSPTAELSTATTPSLPTTTTPAILLGITDATLKLLPPKPASPTLRASRPRSSNAGCRGAHTPATVRCRSPVPPLNTPTPHNAMCNSGGNSTHQQQQQQHSGRLLGLPPSPATPAPSASGPSTSSTMAQVTCRRYMPGSLMRSQTIVGPVGGGGASGGLSSRQPAKISAHLLVQPTPNAANAMTVAVAVATSNQLATSSIAAAATPTTPAATTAAANGGKTNSTAHGTCTTIANNNNNSASGGTTTITQNGGGPATPTTAAGVATKPAPTSEREREQGGDYLIEICGRYLNVYGQGALRFIDKQWNATKAGDVHTLNFSYINFNNIASLLGRVKVRFPQAEHFVFRETNICSLGQLNALAELQGLSTLFIDPEGNPLTATTLWRLYAIYRLSHWGLRQLNGREVTEDEVRQANSMYSGLSELVLWSMPDGMLRPLLSRLRLEETYVASKMSPKLWLIKLENAALRLVVGKEALQWKKSPGGGSGGVGGLQQQVSFCAEVLHTGTAGSVVSAGGGLPSPITPNVNTAIAAATRERGRTHFAAMLENTCNAVEKLHQLETLWPSLLLDIVRNTLLDYSQLETYLRSLLADIMK